MLLALKEIQREKLRYSLIIILIALISYMMFILSALALGLANQNTSAIYGWQADSIALNEQADGVLRASMLTEPQISEIKHHTDGETAEIGFTSTRLITSSDVKESVNFLGVEKDSFISKRIDLAQGHAPQKSHEIVLDQALTKTADISLNDTVTLGSDENTYTVVGIAKDAKLSVVSVAYGLLEDWRNISPVAPTIQASGVVSTKSFTSDDGTIDTAADGTANDAVSVFTIPQFIQLLPGYNAQNTTFVLMIAVLAIVTLIIIAVFLYIIVLQKLPNIAVLKAQGIPTSYLIRSTLLQGLLVVGIGLFIGILATIATALPLPMSVPMSFSLPIQGATTLGLLLMGLLGALLPSRQIRRVDPVSLMQ